jgi:hypothetical protein
MELPTTRLALTDLTMRFFLWAHPPSRRVVTATVHALVLARSMLPDLEVTTTVEVEDEDVN